MACVWLERKKHNSIVTAEKKSFSSHMRIMIVCWSAKTFLYMFHHLNKKSSVIHPDLRDQTHASSRSCFVEVIPVMDYEKNDHWWNAVSSCWNSLTKVKNCPLWGDTAWHTFQKLFCAITFGVFMTAMPISSILIMCSSTKLYFFRTVIIASELIDCIH